MASLIDHLLPFRCRICGERRRTLGNATYHYYMRHGLLQRAWRRLTRQPLGLDVDVRASHIGHTYEIKM